MTYQPSTHEQFYNHAFNGDLGACKKMVDGGYSLTSRGNKTKNIVTNISHENICLYILDNRTFSEQTYETFLIRFIYNGLYKCISFLVDKNLIKIETIKNIIRRATMYCSNLSGKTSPEIYTYLSTTARKYTAFIVYLHSVHYISSTDLILWRTDPSVCSTPEFMNEVIKEVEIEA